MRGAITQATVGVDLVAVITGLPAFPEMPITAGGNAAIIEATVGLRLVGIVAFFNADL